MKARTTVKRERGLPLPEGLVICHRLPVDLVVPLSRGPACRLAHCTRDIQASITDSHMKEEASQSQTSSLVHDISIVEYLARMRTRRFPSFLLYAMRYVNTQRSL